MSAYHDNHDVEKKYQKKIYHDHENNEHENQQQIEKEFQSFRSVMIEIFFNDNSVVKYELAFFICQQTSCFQSFDNAIELKDHVLNYHDVDTRSIEFKYRVREINYIQHAENHVYNFFSSFFMKYVMIQISFFDKDFTSCLNIDENVFFCDRKLLSQSQNHYDLVHDIKFITIIEVADMQVLDEYIEQKMFLKLDKILVFIKIYLINDFQLELIIDMNVLNKNDIDFLFSRQTLKIEDIEISLRYTSSSINEINCFISAVKHDYNHYFYHFVAHTNNDDVIQLKIRK